MLHLARPPESRAELVADPGLIPGAVEEFLRRFPIIADAREVIADIEFEGVSLKKGEMVVMPNALHGLDDRENEDAMKVDFRRNSIQHSSLGTAFTNARARIWLGLKLKSCCRNGYREFRSFPLHQGKP